MLACNRLKKSGISSSRFFFFFCIKQSNTRFTFGYGLLSTFHNAAVAGRIQKEKKKEQKLNSQKIMKIISY